MASLAYLADSLLKCSLFNKELVNENFNFYGTTLSGTPMLKDRWKRAVGLVKAHLVMRLVRSMCSATLAKKPRSGWWISGNLIQAYREDIAALTWMGDETKKKAFIKLDKFTPKIGYPDKWRDYSN